MLFSLLNTLVSTVLPVYVSYDALVKYQRVTADAMSATFKIKGISFPNPLFVDSSNPAPTEQQVQAHSLAVQKWFIFWISRAFCELVESVFFFRYVIPFYGVIKLAFNCWMLSKISIGSTLWKPEVAEEEVWSAALQSSKWHEFCSGGCGLVFYTCVKPLLDYPLDELVSTGGGPSAWMSYANGAISSGLSSTISSTLSRDATGSAFPTLNTGGSEFGSVLGSSYVLVRNFTSMFSAGTGASASSTNPSPDTTVISSSVTTKSTATESVEPTELPAAATTTGTPPTVLSDFDFDLIENAEAEGLTQRKKGWVW